MKRLTKICLVRQNIFSLSDDDMFQSSVLDLSGGGVAGLDPIQRVSAGKTGGMCSLDNPQSHWMSYIECDSNLSEVQSDIIIDINAIF